MKDRDVHLGLQAFLDLEAARRADVFQVDAPERGGQELDGGDDLLHVLRSQADRKGVHVGELLEEHGLAFHHRQRGLGPDVSQPQDGRPVGYDRYPVAARRVFPDLFLILGNFSARLGHAWRVHDAQVLAGPDSFLETQGDLAPELAVQIKGHFVIINAHPRLQ